jgi:hypothetical protein
MFGSTLPDLSYSTLLCIQASDIPSDHCHELCYLLKLVPEDKILAPIS